MDPLSTGEIVPTVDDAGPQALTLHRGTIFFAGSDDEAKPYLGDKTRVVELSVKMLLPGFTDSHSHISIAALFHDAVDLRPAPAG